MDVDVPVVQQQRVGEVEQLGPGFVVVLDDGFGGIVAGCHHPDGARLEQQVVQRCVRQHHADPAVPRGNPVDEIARGGFLDKDDGALP